MDDKDIAGMLTLHPLRTNETLMIGDDVAITIMSVVGNQIRMGIVAPKEVSVHREEIYEAIRRNAEAVAVSSMQK